ncbi:uncharacterized protein LOC144928793 [Branchiostoma floridae x Branchiostoma belcheri]
MTANGKATLCILAMVMVFGANAAPCDLYSVLDDPWRSLTLITNDRHCDKPGHEDSTGLTEGWYRFTGPAGTQMPTVAPGATHLCGTFAPVWMNGQHPTVADGVVTRQACAYRDSNYHCAWRWDIQVAACPGGFYVYYLINTPTCNLGYCAENGAGPTVVSTTTMMTTSPVTDVPSPPVHNSLCYKLSDVTRDYESSTQECAAMGGSLALIGDAGTQSFVAELIRTHSNASHWAGSTSPAVHCSYTGLSAGIGHELWASGQPPIFCVFMDSSADFKLNVAVCSEKHGFVCQSDIVMCQRDICQNGGTCTSCFDDAHTTCTCQPGYTGHRCETHLDLCNPNPCPFDWNCVDTGGSLMCIPKGTACHKRNVAFLHVYA